MRGKLIGRLSKGYRQRVGLAQAILHNPDVLILDEPTAGLDPKQIIETRELIKGLGGDHTIVLSTHILPEVSMTCGRVVIINKGRVVAEDTPENLTHRLRGAAALRLEVRGEAGPAEDALRAVPGVAAVRARAARGGCRASRSSAEPRPRRARRARARAWSAGASTCSACSRSGMSLEEIFLHLTTTDAAAEAPPPAAARRSRRRRRCGMTALRNVWALVREGVAPLLRQPHRLRGALRLDAAVRHLLLRRSSTSSCERSMRRRAAVEMGGGPKMSLNDWSSRRVLHNMAVVALFITPMLTMRLFAEEKRQGTIELLATSPLTDLQIVLGKFLAAVGLYALMILAGLVNLAAPLVLRHHAARVEAGG